MGQLSRAVLPGQEEQNDFGVRTVLSATSGDLGVAWDQRAAVTGMRTDSNLTSGTLPLTLGKTEVAEGS